MNRVSFQIFVFIYTIYGGVLIGLLFDIYKALSGRSKRGKNVVWDILFLLLSLGIFTWILFLSTYGQMRMYMLLGIIIGLTFYEKFFSLPAYRFFLDIKAKIIGVFRLKVMYNIFYKPIHLMGRSVKKFFTIPRGVWRDFIHYYKMLSKKRE